MNADDLIIAALAVHTSGFALSLAGVYAVFGDKFIRPTIERADTLCAKLRGELSKHLAESLSRFLASDKPPSVVNVRLYGPDNRPMESADITNATSLESEAFQEAVRAFLDGESAAFDRYRDAFGIRSKIRGHWTAIRTIIGAWPICGLIAIGVFWALSKKVIPVPPEFWLWSIAAIPLLPLLMFAARLPMLARASTLLEGMGA